MKPQAHRANDPAPSCPSADAAVAHRLEPVLNALRQLETQNARTAELLSDIHEWLLERRPRKQWYSPAEAAEILGKSAFTVREWCRLNRINARKRPTGRGDAQEWEISDEEIERIKNHGLLPTPTPYRHPKM